MSSTSLKRTSLEALQNTHPNTSCRELNHDNTAVGLTRRAGATEFTCRGADGGRDGRGCHGGHAVVVLGVAGLDGTQVAVAPCAEAARQIQGLHGLRLHLAEDRLAHGFKLPVDLRLAHLNEGPKWNGD